LKRTDKDLKAWEKHIEDGKRTKVSKLGEEPFPGLPVNSQNAPDSTNEHERIVGSTSETIYEPSDESA